VTEDSFIVLTSNLFAIASLRICTRIHTHTHPLHLSLSHTHEHTHTNTGVTEDPFIVFTSNIFAIASLRALYSVLAKLAKDLEYLDTAVGGVSFPPFPALFGFYFLDPLYIHVSAKVAKELKNVSPSARLMSV